MDKQFAAGAGRARRAGRRRRGGGRDDLSHAQIHPRRLPAGAAGAVLASRSTRVSLASIAASATTAWKNPGSANLPGASTCMNCHNVVLKDDPRLQIVRDSATNNTPIPWVQVHKVPDYVYFNHSVHVDRGISCVECHGRVDQMDEVRHDKSFSMSFCLDCHRDPAANIRPTGQSHQTRLAVEHQCRRSRAFAGSERQEIRPRLESGIAAKLLGLSPINEFNIPTNSTPANAVAAVTGAAWMNWPTRRSSRTGCTANFRPARARWWKTARAAAIS